MTREALRVVLDRMLCGCASPELAVGALLRLLRLHPLYDHRAEVEAWIPDEGVRLLLLYRLDEDALTEHGSTVEGGWLTDKGQDVLDALAREEPDGFAALLSDHCAHGYDIPGPHRCV